MGASDHDQMQAIFRETLRPFAESLRDFADAAIERPQVPDAESEAMRELSQESRWSTSDWQEPARNAHAYGRVLCHHLLDHADSYAAIATSTTFGPSFAHATILRSVLEVAVTTCWLLEPAIGTERRIQRSIVYRIDSPVNLGRIPHPAAKASADHARMAATAYAAAQTWPVQNLPGGGRKRVGREEMPAPDRAFSEMVYGRRSEASDAALWNYLSAVAHGTFYAVQQALAPIPGVMPDPLDPTGAMRGISASTDNVLTIGRVLFQATHAAVRCRDAINGWSPSPEELDAVRRLETATAGTKWRFKP